MSEYIDVVVEKPTRDFWCKSLKEILDSTPGSHFGLEPVAIVTKYFFDYSVYDDEVEENLAQRDDEISKKIAELLDFKSRSRYGNGIYHWKDSSYKKLCTKVKKTLGSEYVKYIEPKMVLICRDKLAGSLEEVMELFRDV